MDAPEWSDCVLLHFSFICDVMCVVSVCGAHVRPGVCRAASAG